MTEDENYSLSLRNLSSDYYFGRIEFDEYRLKRKTILDKIDAEFNGRQYLEGEPVPQDDEKSILMQTIKFFKSKDVT